MTCTPLDTGNRWAVLGFTLFVLGVVALVARAAPAFALINESPSLPEGLYLLRPGAAVTRGAVVAVDPPAPAQAYLSQLGAPTTRLLKRVAAIEGDRVCRQAGAVRIEGRVAPVLERDRRGAVLPGWRDCRRLAAGEVFLLGDTPTSFDSRYFGPVRRQALVGVYQGVWRW